MGLVGKYEFVLRMQALIDDYLKDIYEALQKGNSMEVNENTEKLNKAINQKILQIVKDTIEEEKREKLKQEINGYIKNATQKREEEIRIQTEKKRMWELRDEDKENNEKDASNWVEKLYYENKQKQIKTENDLENEHKRIKEEIINGEKDLTKCNEIFSKLENGYKDLLVKDHLYQDIKDHLIEKYTAKEIEKALNGKRFSEIYKSLVEKCNTIPQEHKIRLIDRFKNIRERESLLQDQPYRVINSKVQLSVYFDMIESRYEGILPIAYQKAKQDMLENYSEEKTYIMPKDLTSYFQKILNEYEQNKQFPEEYSKECKELQTAIEQQTNPQKAKLENMEQKKQIRDKKVNINEENLLPKNNIFRNIYESAKTKVISVFSVFRKNKAQSFLTKGNNTKSNKFKEEITKRVPTLDEQAQNARQYQKEKYKTTNDKALDNINSIINNNYNIR